MKKLLTTLLVLVMLVPYKAHALFGDGDIVYDPSAVAQLVQQVQKTITMISQLRNVNEWLQGLNNWEEIDHVNLAGSKFMSFFNQYRSLFDQVMSEIQGYQNGGLMGKIDELDSRYPAYHADWGNQIPYMENLFQENPELAENTRVLKKQLLLTKIQMKHALKVGSKIRESLPQSEEQTRVLLDDTAQAVGLMQSVKIGNQLTGMVAESLQKLNVQMNEYLQAFSGSELERNYSRGLRANRAQEAINGFGERTNYGEQAPLNPIGASNGR